MLSFPCKSDYLLNTIPILFPHRLVQTDIFNPPNAILLSRQQIWEICLVKRKVQGWIKIQTFHSITSKS